MSHVQAIHDFAIRILEEVGVVVDHPDGRRPLQDRGCILRDGRVCFPSQIVRHALARVPRSFVVRGRESSNDVEVGYTQMACMNAGVFPWIEDWNTRQTRMTTLRDVAMTTHVLDQLDQLDLVFAPMVDATELSGPDKPATLLETVLRHTRKPIIGPGLADAAEARAVIRLLAGQPRPRATPFVCANSPLRYDAGTLEALILIVEAGLPVDLITNPVMGLSGPFTLAGTIAMGHAEALAGVVLVQALKPGQPVLTQNTPSVVDLQSMTSSAGGPETGLMRRTIALLGRQLGIPSHVSGHTSSPVLDNQACDEKTLNQTLIAEAGPSILAGLGALGNAMVTSYETLVLDNERYAALRRVRRDVATDGDRLNFAALREGLAAGEFLSLDHTLRHMQSDEVWRPAVTRRSRFDPAATDSSQRDRARLEVGRMLGSFTS